MPTLQIRNLPQEVYDNLAAQAKRERRSLSQQAAALLETCTKFDEERLKARRALAERLRRGPRIKWPDGLPDIEQIIREGRESR